MLESDIVTAVLASLGREDESVSTFTLACIGELAKYGTFSPPRIGACIHRGADDSRYKMLESNIVAAVRTKLADKDKFVRQAALGIAGDFAKYGTLSVRR